MTINYYIMASNDFTNQLSGLKDIYVIIGLCSCKYTLRALDLLYNNKKNLLFIDINEYIYHDSENKENNLLTLLSRVYAYSDLSIPKIFHIDEYSKYLIPGFTELCQLFIGCDANNANNYMYADNIQQLICNYDKKLGVAVIFNNNTASIHTIKQTSFNDFLVDNQPVSASSLYNKLYGVSVQPTVLQPTHPPTMNPIHIPTPQTTTSLHYPSYTFTPEEFIYGLILSFFEQIP